MINRSSDLRSLIKTHGPAAEHYESLIMETGAELDKFFIQNSPSAGGFFKNNTSLLSLKLNSHALLDSLMEVFDQQIKTQSSAEMLNKVLKTMQANFIKNIKLAVQRIQSDAEMIKKGFLADMQDPQLVNMESSGSDFHKGGSQVLFLTFKDKQGAERRIIYKPSSVQADVMLTGDVQRLQEIDASYKNQASMAEIFNRNICAKTTPEHPDLMPTYLIVPRFDEQRSADYGYAQFITQEPSFHPDPKDDADTMEEKYEAFLRKAAADPKCDFILRTEEEKQLFSYQAGLTTAMIGIVSGADFQQENAIISQRRFVVIDAESILTPAIRPTCQDAILFTPVGIASLSPLSLIEHPNFRSPYPGKNRVFFLNAKNNELQPYLVEESAYLQGYKDGLNALAAKPEILAWFQQEKIQNMRTRFIPFETNKFMSDMQGLNLAGLSLEAFKKYSVERYDSEMRLYYDRLDDLNAATKNNPEKLNELVRGLKEAGISPESYLSLIALSAMPLPTHMIFSTLNNKNK